MADSTIGSLPSASEITAEDLLVMEQNGEAKKVSGEVLTAFINRDILSVTVTDLPATSSPTVAFNPETGAMTLGVPRGSTIESIGKVSTSGLVDTYRITLQQLPSESAPTMFTFTVTNGKGITSITAISAQHNPGTFDTYAINFNDNTSTTFQVYNGTNGTNGVSITAINKSYGTGAGGTTDVYDVRLSDGTSAGTFTVYNGADGQGSPGSATPLMDGSASAGVALAYSREDHVHPTDTTRQAANLYFTDQPANSWAAHSDTMFADYDYRCAIALSGVTAAMFADVILAPTEALSGKYAPVCVTYNGGVYIYSTDNTTITIPTIVIMKQ